MTSREMKNSGLHGFSTFLGGVVLLVTVALSLAGCGGGGSSSGGGSGSASSTGSSSTTTSSGGCTLTTQQLNDLGNINDLPPECLTQYPEPEENLLGRILVLGTQEDPVSGALHVFVSGTDSSGNPLGLTDFQAATVSVAGFPVNPGLVSVEPVMPGDDILSLGFATDYSTSISDAELDAISTVYLELLDGLPPVLEGQVINFSSSAQVQQDWTEDRDLLKTALQRNNSFNQQNTAFYDALGFSLQRDLALDGDGLIERCRPAHMLVVFTDGAENASIQYTKDTLLPIIHNSNTVMIMLGGLNADKDALVEMAGDRGAFIYAYNLATIRSEVQKWASSLSNMVKFTLDPATGFNAGNITIALGSQAVAVERPTDGYCEVIL